MENFYISQERKDALASVKKTIDNSYDKSIGWMELLKKAVVNTCGEDKLLCLPKNEAIQGECMYAAGVAVIKGNLYVYVITDRTEGIFDSYTTVMFGKVVEGDDEFEDGIGVPTNVLRKMCEWVSDDLCDVEMDLTTFKTLDAYYPELAELCKYLNENKEEYMDLINGEKACITTFYK